MAIYDINGDRLSSAYTVDGVALTAAYSMTGTQVFPDVPPAEANFVVMTHNVQNGFWNGLEQSLELQQYFISTYNPDVIGMQELGSSTDIPGYVSAAYVDYQNREIGPEAVVNRPGIISKIQFAEASSGVFTAQKGYENRGYNIIRVTANGKSVLIANTHLHPSDQATKIAQAQELFDIVKDEPYFIVLGDFNTVCMSTSHAEYIGIYKPFVDMGCHLANCSEEAGWHYTYFSATTPEESAKGPNDSIIVSPSIELVDVMFDTYKFQLATEQDKKIDHIPIIAYLTIN